eukprot:scaffold133458_cov41-Prasinocladus_malaysianus.AAC.2
MELLHQVKLLHRLAHRGGRVLALRLDGPCVEGDLFACVPDVGVCTGTFSWPNDIHHTRRAFAEHLALDILA